MFLLLIILFFTGSFSYGGGSKAVFALSFDKKETDASGVDNAGQFFNVKRIKGRKGTAVKFSGDNSYIRCENKNIFNIEKQFSIELWIKPVAWPKGKYQGIIAKFPKKADVPGWALYYAGHNNKLCFRVNMKTKAVSLNTYAPTPGKWHHLAVTYRQGRLALYVDGNIKMTNPMTGVMTNKEALIIGRMYAKHKKWSFSGEIDEVKIYDKTLSPQIIYQHAKEFSPKKPKGPKVIDYPKSVEVKSNNLLSAKNNQLNGRAKVIYFKPDINRKKASEMAVKLKNHGVNIVFPESYRYLFGMKGDEKNWFNSPPMPDYIKATKIVTEELHKQGIKFIAHLTGFCVLKQFQRKHHEWSMISMDDGKPGYFAGYKTYLMCPNNPGFSNYFLKVLKNMLSETKIDGVMLEETAWFAWNNCVCDHCKKKFKIQTGYNFPERKSKIWRNEKSAQWRAWVDFRIKSIGEFRQKVKETMNSVRQGMLYTGCLANELVRHQFNGRDVESAANNGENILFYESEPSNPWSWLCNFVEAKYYSGFRPAFQLQYNGSKSQKYFSWAFSLTCGHMPWIWKTYIPKLWEQKWESLLLAKECVTDVALLISSPTKNLYQNGNTKRYVDGYIGWGEALTEAHIAYDSVASTQLNRNLLEKYSVVIMPNIALLSKKEVNILQEYVKSGGTIIATYETSLYDETGLKRKNFALSDVLGVSYKKISYGNFTFLEKIKKSIKYSGKHIVQVENKTAKVNIRTKGGKIGISYNNFGKGNAFYFSFQPGLMYYMPKIGGGRFGNGSSWKDNRNISYKNMMINAVTKYSKTAFRVVSAPENILINPLTFKTKKGAGIVVHLLNCQGTAAVDGTFKVPDNYDYEFLNYPALKKPIKLVIQGIKGNYAYMVSPDFTDVVKLPIKENGTILVLALRRYAIIYIPDGKKDIVSDIVGSNNFVTEVPNAVKFRFKNKYK